MQIASIRATLATMATDELEDALRVALIDATRASGNGKCATLELIDEYFAMCPEPEDEAEWRRDLVVLLSTILEPRTLITC